VYDASSRKDIRKAERASRAAEVARIDYLKAAMSVPQGRAWFHDLLVFTHVFDDPFTGNALAEAYRKGERNVGLRIFADIVAHCPDDYIKMVREENGRNIERAVHDARNPTEPEHDGSEIAGWDVEGSVDNPIEDGHQPSLF
jgi:hypothetical protein